MRGTVRRKLEMGDRVRHFGQTQPSGDPSVTTLLGELDTLLTRADTAAATERNGRLEARALVARRSELRGIIGSLYLRHLVEVGREVARTEPALAGLFRLRMPNATHKAFLISSRAMLAEATARKDAFVARGLSQPVLDELGKDLAEFEAMGGRGLDARRAHIGGRVELAELADRVSSIVTRLDTLFQIRFKRDPAQLAGWDAARALVQGPFRRPAPPAPPAAEVPAEAEGKEKGKGKGKEPAA